MGYQDRKESTASRIGIRTRIIIDIFMGLFYSVIGATIIIYRSFGNNEMPAFIAYILGSMLVIGGIFRFIRGLKGVLPQKPEQTAEQSEDQES